MKTRFPLQRWNKSLAHVLVNVRKILPGWTDRLLIRPTLAKDNQCQSTFTVFQPPCLPIV